MHGPFTIRGGPNLGERLYSWVTAGEAIMNSVKLLCRDGTTVRILHRDVLQAASPYFRQIIAGNSEQDKPIPVAVSGRMLDLAIEFIYTTRIKAVEIHELVEVYAVADLFQLDELCNQLRDFFRDNMRECLQKEEFFINRPLEDMKRFVGIFPITLEAREQVRLIQAIYDWAKRQAVDGARVSDLIARIVTRPKLAKVATYIVESALSSGRPQTVALLVGETQILQIVHDSFVDAELPSAVVERLIKSDSACISGNEVFIIKPNEVTVCDLITGEQIRSFSLPFDWRAWSEKLILRRGRAYTWHENDVFHLSGDAFVKISQSKSGICDLAIIEHDASSFRFAYENRDKQVFIVAGAGRNSAASEEAIPIQNIELVGVHEDAVIVCRSIDELMVYQNGAVVWKHYLGGTVEYIFCTGNIVYIKRPNDLYIVDIVSRSINTISPVPLGHFMIREILD